MIRLYGSSISYYAGKLEAYLRFRGHAYELLPHGPHAREIIEGSGAFQSPVIQLADGRWAADTTPLLRWFESERTDADGPSIFPDDPALRFLALLLEDHADEWLWRPAMHYRWSYRQDRQHASGVIANDANKPLPQCRTRSGISPGDQLGPTAQFADHERRQPEFVRRVILEPPGDAAVGTIALA